jgi:hypothetical protein
MRPIINEFHIGMDFDELNEALFGATSQDSKENEDRENKDKND